ncbi:TPA: hypothetical protein ACH1JE_002028, partial [Streptococcus pneumoniae]
QKRKDEFCPFSSLADFNPLQLTKSQKRKDEICPFSTLADFNPLQLTKSQKNPLFSKQRIL